MAKKKDVVETPQANASIVVRQEETPGTRKRYTDDEKHNLLSAWDSYTGSNEEKHARLQKEEGYPGSLGGWLQNRQNWTKGKTAKTSHKAEVQDETAWIDAIPELFRQSALQGTLDALNKKHGHKFKLENLKKALQLDSKIQAMHEEVKALQENLKAL